MRFSDKNQKAVDLLRTRCLKLKCLVLSDGRLYEIMRGNFERADRRSVIREVSQWRREDRNKQLVSLIGGIVAQTGDIGCIMAIA